MFLGGSIPSRFSRFLRIFLVFAIWTNGSVRSNWAADELPSFRTGAELATEKVSGSIIRQTEMDIVAQIQQHGCRLNQNISQDMRGSANTATYQTANFSPEVRELSLWSELVIRTSNRRFHPRMRSFQFPGTVD